MICSKGVWIEYRPFSENRSNLVVVLRSVGDEPGRKCVNVVDRDGVRLAEVFPQDAKTMASHLYGPGAIPRFHSIRDSRCST